MIKPIIRNNDFIKDVLIEVHTADLHFGNNSVDPSTEFKILEEQFLIPVSQIPFDALYIDGDIYDHKVMTNSDTTMYVTMFIDQCVNLCRSNNATLVIIAGTKNHDDDQLKIFYHYLSDTSVDVRIVEQAKFEFVKGKRVLCLPEEYNKGSEYYEDLLYKSGFYDSVAMHGTIAGSVIGCDKEDLNGERAVFDLHNFCYCMGPIISGHVHTPMCLKGYMYYTGNPIRYRFGEEHAKGFTILVHNIRTRGFYTHFQEIESFRFDTINLDSLVIEDPKLVIAHIKQLQTQGIHNIRIEFTTETPNVDIVKNYYRTSQTIKVKDDRKKVSGIIQDPSEVNEADLNDTFQKYAFLFDNQSTPYDKLAKYINTEKGFIYITSDELIKIIEEID